MAFRSIKREIIGDEGIGATHHRKGHLWRSEIQRSCLTIIFSNIAFRVTERKLLACG